MSYVFPGLNKFKAYIFLYTKKLGDQITEQGKLYGSSQVFKYSTPFQIQTSFGIKIEIFSLQFAKSHLILRFDHWNRTISFDILILSNG